MQILQEQYICPVAHSQSPLDPAIELHCIVVLQPASIMRHPTLNILPQAIDSRLDGDARASASDVFEFLSKTLNLAVQRF